MRPQRYSTAAITLHWALALLLAFQISLGWTMEGPNTAELFARFQLHKSIGILILVLSLIRLAIRFTAPRPAPSEGPPWAHALAGLVHALFYVVMIAGPITGWIIVSTARVQVPTLLFGAIPLPHLPVGRALHGPAEAAHSAMAWLAIILFLMHVAGALRHQWLLGKPELQRMIPFARGRAVNTAIGAVLLVIAAMFVAKTVYPDKPKPEEVMAAPGNAADNAMNDSAANAVENAAIALNEAATATNTAAANVAEATKQPLANWAVSSGGRLGFTARWNGDAVKGSFKSWQAAIRFSPDDLAGSTIRVTIDLGSVDTADSQRDSSLTGSDFFDTGVHPRATFTSRSIRHLSGDRYEAAGTLDLHGVSKPTTVRFTLKIVGDKATVSGTSRIDRTSFGVGSGEWATTDSIAGAVDIDFAFSATR